MFKNVELKMKKRKGFDLVQLGIWTLAVIILLGVALPRYNDFQERNKRSATRQEARTLAEQCALYAGFAKNSQVPATLGSLVTGLTAAQSNDDLAHANFITKPTFTNDPSSFVDAWGNTYQYNSASRTITSTANGGTPIVESF
jgi:type II secretory pathway pseudopilin PulG